MCSGFLLAICLVLLCLLVKKHEFFTCAFASLATCSGNKGEYRSPCVACLLLLLLSGGLHKGSGYAVIQHVHGLRSLAKFDSPFHKAVSTRQACQLLVGLRLKAAVEMYHPYGLCDVVAKPYMTVAAFGFFVRKATCTKKDHMNYGRSLDTAILCQSVLYVVFGRSVCCRCSVRCMTIATEFGRTDAI